MLSPRGTSGDFTCSDLGHPPSLPLLLGHEHFCFLSVRRAWGGLAPSSLPLAARGPILVALDCAENGQVEPHHCWEGQFPVAWGGAGVERAPDLLVLKLVPNMVTVPLSQRSDRRPPWALSPENCKP